MALIEINKLSFTYKDSDKKALKDISLSVEEGEFVIFCGPSGCGKTTLLNQLKKEIGPLGFKEGEILYSGKSIEDVGKREMVEEIAMVFQDPESQIVSDSVYHELAFSLENLAYPPNTIKMRLGEVVNFFGMEDIFYESVENLSGGQKQMLNLASVLVLHPRVLLLDEPTSQLDPIASRELLQMIYKLNRDFSVTVLMTEHRIEDTISLGDKLIVMDRGEIKYMGNPRKVLKDIFHNNDERFIEFVPQIPKYYLEFEGDEKWESIPLTVREGRTWIDKANINIDNNIENERIQFRNEIQMDIKNISFKYERGRPDVLKNLDLKVYSGEILALLGGNGAGKSTLLKIMAGMMKPQRGKVYLKKDKIGYLPQNLMTYFLYDTVEEEIYEMAAKFHVDDGEVEKILDRLAIVELLNRHPYDLSGGEKQKVVLASILLSEPDVLILDEPTKGLDPLSKKVLMDYMTMLKNDGMTIIMATHDLEFAEKISDRCALLFNGEIACEEVPEVFFRENYFYTTAINKIIRNKYPKTIQREEN